MHYRPGLNELGPLGVRLRNVLANAESVDFAVAYAKASGVYSLIPELPVQVRAVIGLGFGLTDPEAVERLADHGVEVRVVADGTLAASQFHPKLYLVTSGSDIVVFSGSANLTAGGLESNVEQFEELTFGLGTPGAHLQAERFDHLWDIGRPLLDVQQSGEWKRYARIVAARRSFERTLRRVKPGSKGGAGSVYSARKPGRVPGWLGLASYLWWDNQRTMDHLDGPVFMRRAGSGQFTRLEAGGLFFYLISRPGQAEEERTVEGFSEYNDDFEFSTRRASWERYRHRVGYRTWPDYVQGDPDERLGLILLERIHVLARPLTLHELRANRVPFPANVQQGRGLSGGEVATVLGLAGGFS